MYKHQGIILPILICLVILPRLSIDFYLPSLPDIGKTFSANDHTLQMTLTVFMFGYALSMLIAGPLSDMMGRKQVLLTGLVIYLIATLCCALAPSIFFLIVSRFFQALGGCCGTVIARVMVKEYYNQAKQIKILSHLSVAMAICPLLIPILGGTVQLVTGWRTTFYLLSVVACILLLINYQQLQEPKGMRKFLSLKMLGKYYKELLTNRIFLGYSLSISLAWCVYFSFTLESPFLLQKTLGYDAISFGFFFAIIVIGYVIGTQFTKFFANQIGWDELIFIATLICLSGSIIMCVAVICMPLNIYILIFPMLISMVGVGIIIPCTQAAVMQPFSHIAGTASGLFFFLQMSFGGVCGLILQFFDHINAYPLAITMLIASIFLTLSFYKLIWCKKTRITLYEMLSERS